MDSLVEETLRVLSVLPDVRNHVKLTANVKELISCIDFDVDYEFNCELNEKVIETLTQVSFSIQTYVDGNIDINSLLDTVQELHDLLIPLDDEWPGVPKLKTSIARICEKYWNNKIRGAEYLMAQLLPYFLLTSLGEKATIADIKRLIRLREAFDLLDFKDESISSVLELLMRTLICPVYLKGSEGERFLSWMFSLDGGCLIPSIIEVVKPQLAAGARVKVANKYGDVLFRAWKESEGNTSVRALIESEVQGLAYTAMHAENAKYASNLRVLLAVFHANKAVKGVDSMLVSVYDPIIWRALQCANAEVRAQSAVIFLDAFPLLNAEEGSGRCEERLQRQFECMQQLLGDEDHRVRTGAARGAGCALRDYWEMVPVLVLKELLVFIFSKLVRDISCVNVRIAALEGIGEILTNKLSHRALIPLIKSIAFVIHDRADRVREAFIRILQKVTSIEGLHFYDVVSLEDLLTLLVSDAGRNSSVNAMVELLKSSFYPQRSDGNSVSADQLNRCLTFIEANEDAARVFYGELHRVTSVGSVTKLAMMLLTHTLDLITDQQAGDEQTSQSQQQQPHHIGGILAVLQSILSSLVSKLDQDKFATSRAFLFEHAQSESLASLVEYGLSHLDGVGLVSLIHVITTFEKIARQTGESFLGSPQMTELIMRFENIPVQQQVSMTQPQRQQYYQAYIELLATTEQLDTLLGRVHQSLRLSLLSASGSGIEAHLAELQIGSPDPKVKASGKAGKRKQAHKSKTQGKQASLDTATSFDILSSYSDSSLPMTCMHRKLSNVPTNTTSLFQLLTTRCRDIHDATNAEGCLKIFETCMTLAIQKIDVDTPESIGDLEAILDWIHDEVLSQQGCANAGVEGGVLPPSSPLPLPPRNKARKAEEIAASSNITTTNTATTPTVLAAIHRNILQKVFAVLSDYYLCYGTFSSIDTRLTSIVEQLLSTCITTKESHFFAFQSVGKLCLVLIHKQVSACWRTVFDYFLWTFSTEAATEGTPYTRWIRAFLSRCTDQSLLMDIMLHRVIGGVRKVNKVDSTMIIWESDAVDALFRCISSDELLTSHFLSCAHVLVTNGDVHEEKKVFSILSALVNILSSCQHSETAMSKRSALETIVAEHDQRDSLSVCE